jgi:23S rRNA pseudouridine1911/1915/1917 synthase
LNENKNKIIVAQSGIRLDKFILSHYPNFSRSYIQNLILKGNIVVNNSHVKTGYKIKKNDLILIDIPTPEPSIIKPENIPLNLVYEDDYLVVVNKPAGLVVHPGAGNYSGTLVNALLYHCKTLSGMNGILRPGIVHRLDKNTSGLMVIAKDNATHVALARQFEKREIVRTYFALVWGAPENESGIIETLINRSRRDRKKMAVSSDRGKSAVTIYKRIQSFQYFSLLELILKTGRTHQIRVHLNYIHHPVFGDPDYNGRHSQLKRLPSFLHKRGLHLLKSIDRQALHAKKIEFIHPHSAKKVFFDSELPSDMDELIKRIPSVMLLDI